MRKRIWLGLLMILAIATVTGWNWYSQQIQSATPPAEVTAADESQAWGQNGNDTMANITRQAAAQSPVNTPAVPQEQLLSHIKALDLNVIHNMTGSGLEIIFPNLSQHGDGRPSYKNLIQGSIYGRNVRERIKMPVQFW